MNGSAGATWYERWKAHWRRIERSPAAWWLKRQVRMLTGRELRTFIEVRRPRRRYGEWTFDPTGIGAESVVYSFGVGRDLEFELSLEQRHGPTVHVFDPTPVSRTWVESRKLPERVHFHPIGIAGRDGTAWFEPPVRDTDVSHSITLHPSAHTVELPVQRLGTIMRSLGHRQLDLLKLDIEGAEYDVIRDVLESEIPVRQLLVEFHHRFRGIGNDATAAALAMLHRSGYRIFHIAAHGREYALMKTAPRMATGPTAPRAGTP